MNVLEKILEEIEERRGFRETLVKYEKKNGTIVDVERNRCALDELDIVERIIRPHMGEVANMSGKRLIDANALDDEVMNLFIAITGNPKQTTVIRECKESFRRMIDEQPTVYVNDGWIPVSERLPEKAGTYIVSAKDGKREIVTFVKWQNRFKKWDLSGTRAYWKINAWKPLPKPYKGE